MGAVARSEQIESAVPVLSGSMTIVSWVELYHVISQFIGIYNHGDTHLQPLLHPQVPNTLKWLLSIFVGRVQLRDLRIAVAWSRQKRKRF